MNRPLALTLTARIGLRSSGLPNILLVAAGSLLVAGLAQIRIPLPFTPVPITGQTLGVFLVGATMGSSRAALSLGLYLLAGSLGLPFFAGGASGWNHVFGPTGGYLLGFILAAYVVGHLAERGWDRSILRVAAMFAIGEAIILGLGALVLSRFIGLEKAWLGGILPFLPGDAFKALIAALLLPTAHKIIDPQT
ncbi:biotin transporter BioY [Thermanaerothrix sp. 4228-RoL]|jgi:biotin transport system substrate-specific component|uniref:Biotin transporter n=1 Tax=Thermanaerothrix solaris TaxID=3058434 RepID=A0ABU3NKR9_9CHLR|nr:biotin transporter BioY [Thermanaerothrix sp. 4228-RoL]MDT8897414.1 biotin transporter BioY [Thermanaerothrix sp. 4228-RoL]